MPRKRVSAKPTDRLQISAVHSADGGGGGYLLPFLEHPGTAVCLCVDKNYNVLAVKQYRPVVGARLIEVPGGIIRPGETPQQAAVRETAEETGIRPARLVRLGTFFSSVGLSNERIHVFVSREFSGSVRAEKGILAYWLPLPKLIEATRKRHAVDVKTALGVWLLQRRLDRSSR